MTDGLRRKSQHLDIVLGRDVRARALTTGLEAVQFEHVALPELALDEIDLSTTFLGRRLDAFTSLGDDLQHGLHVFAAEATLLAQQVPQLLEDALGLADLRVGAFEDQLVAAADELLHAQGGADFAQKLIPAAKQQDRFVAAIEGDGCFAHPFTRNRARFGAISQRHEKCKARFASRSGKEPPVGHRGGEQHRIDHVEEAAEARQQTRGVLLQTVTLDERLRQIAQNPRDADDQPERRRF